MPLLGSERSYSVDYPIDSDNSLVATPHAPIAPITDVELLKIYFSDNWETMYEIAMCESRNRQFVDGKPLESPKNTNGTKDWGYMEINDSHQALADKLGLDYKNSLEDNIHLARVIYDSQGYTAWTCYSIIKGTYK